MLTYMVTRKPKAAKRGVLRTIAVFVEAENRAHAIRKASEVPTFKDDADYGAIQASVLQYNAMLYL